VEAHSTRVGRFRRAPAPPSRWTSASSAVRDMPRTE